MSIRIGNQSAYSAAHMMEPFEYAVAHGFDAFEWFPDRKASGVGWGEEDLDKKTRDLIRTVAKKHDIYLTVHAPWHWNPLDEKTCRFFQKSMAFAKDIQAGLINIHFVQDEGVNRLLEAIVPLAQDLVETGIMLSLENTPLTPPDDFNAFFAQLERLEPAIAAQVGMCLDLGHANLCASTQNDYLRFIDLLEPQVPIVHVHMHENYGDHDAHLPLFTGPASQDNAGIAGFVERMKGRRFSGTIIMEQWPEPSSLLDDARNKLLQLWAG